MKSKEESTSKYLDIDKEYESIFGVVQRSTLYELTDEYYETFRLQIISSPPETYDKRKFPFSDITFITQVDSIDSLPNRNNEINHNQRGTLFGMIDKNLSNEISNLLLSLNNQVSQSIGLILSHKMIMANC